MGSTEYIVETSEGIVVFRVHHYISSSRVSVLYSCAGVDDALAAYPHAKRVTPVEFARLRADIKARAKVTR